MFQTSYTLTVEPQMSNDSEVEQIGVLFIFFKCFKKLSEFERIRTEPAKPNTLESSRVRRTHGVGC